MSYFYKVEVAQMDSKTVLYLSILLVIIDYLQQNNLHLSKKIKN